MIEVLLCLIVCSTVGGIVHRVCLKHERLAKLKLDARVLALPDDDQKKLQEPKLGGEWQGEP